MDTENIFPDLKSQCHSFELPCQGGPIILSVWLRAVGRGGGHPWERAGTDFKFSYLETPVNRWTSCRSQIAYAAHETIWKPWCCLTTVGLFILWPLQQPEMCWKLKLSNMNVDSLYLWSSETKGLRLICDFRNAVHDVCTQTARRVMTILVTMKMGSQLCNWISNW